ncbi:unnamed protein product, partial [Sphacelaria rigidula]
QPSYLITLHSRRTGTTKLSRHITFARYTIFQGMIARARERVRDDGALVGEVASKVSGALGLDSVNRTLGRNVVIAALDAHIASTASQNVPYTHTSSTLSPPKAPTCVPKTSGTGITSGDNGREPFLEAAKKYGRNLSDEMLSDVYRKVTTRLKGAAIQLQAMQHEEEARGDDNGEGAAGPGDAGAGLLGFGKAERLSGLGVGGAGKLKGGLVKKHTFQAPAPRTQQGSLLGLDKLAAQQRADKLAALEAAVGGAGGDRPRHSHAGLSFGEGRDEDDDGEDDDEGWAKKKLRDKRENGGGVGGGSKESSKRQYRSRPGPDTPSHPGGVNREIKGKIDEKERLRRKSGGVGVVGAVTADPPRDGAGSSDKNGQRDKDRGRRDGSRWSSREHGGSGDGDRYGRRDGDSRGDDRSSRRGSSRDHHSDRREDSSSRSSRGGGGRSRDASDGNDRRRERDGRDDRRRGEGGDGGNGGSKRSRSPGSSRSRNRSRSRSPERRRPRTKSRWEDAVTPRSSSSSCTSSTSSNMSTPPPTSHNNRNTTNGNNNIAALGLGPRRIDGARSDLTRAGLGLDESEWDEPQRLSSTPLPSPGGASSVGGE